MGLGNYIDLDVGDDVVGIQALRDIKTKGPQRHQLGVILDGDSPATPPKVWNDIMVDGQKVGDMTNGVWSYRLKRNIGYALVPQSMKSGDKVAVRRDGAVVSGVLCDLPFI